MATAIYNAVTSLGQSDVYQEWSDASTSLAVRPHTHLHARIRCRQHNGAACLLNQSNPHPISRKLFILHFPPLFYFGRVTVDCTTIRFWHPPCKTSSAVVLRPIAFPACPQLILVRAICTPTNLQRVLSDRRFSRLQPFQVYNLLLSHTHTHKCIYTLCGDCGSGTFPFVKVDNMYMVSGTVRMAVDVFHAINLCRGKGSLDEDISIDIILTASATLSIIDPAPLLCPKVNDRNTDIQTYDAVMNDIGWAKIAHPEVLVLECTHGRLVHSPRSQVTHMPCRLISVNWYSRPKLCRLVTCSTT